MKKDFDLLLDFLFYFILPILFWKAGRVYFSDYITILVSAFPGILYSLYRFYTSKEAIFTRMFFFINIVMGLLIDFCSGSAIKLLWNDAFYSLGLCLLYFASCFTRKPLYYYFSLDILIVQGYDRKITMEFFMKKEAQLFFKILSGVNGIFELAYSMFLMNFIPKYGVEIYTMSILADQIMSLFMSIMFSIAFFLLHQFMNEMVTVNNSSRKKKKMKKPLYLYSYLIENRYFFMRKHFH